MSAPARSPTEVVHLPRPAGLPLLGNLLQVDPARIHLSLEDWARQLGARYQIKLGTKCALVIADWQDITALLRARPETFRRFSSVETVFADMGMGGLLSAEGEQWHRQRKLTVRAFDPGHLRDYFPSLVQITERLRQRWVEAAQEGRTVDLQADLMCYSVDVTAGLAFGSDINTIAGHDSALQQCLDQVFPVINRRLNSPVPYWRYVKLPSDKLLDRNMALLRKRVDGFIADARRRMQTDPGLFTRPGNMLEAFLAVRDQAGAEFTDDDVYGNVFTTLLVGPDSTANVFAWMTHLLCANPDALALVREEVAALMGTQTVPDRFSTLSEMQVMDAAVQETMRLKPSGPILFLEAKHETTVGSVTVRPGTPIIALTRVCALEATHFSQPAAFNPARWLASALSAGEPAALEAAVSKRVTLPFGAGARLCPGRYLALVQLKMLGAMLAHNFDVEAIEPNQVAERFKFSMGPVNLRVKLHRRPNRPQPQGWA